MQSWCLQGPQLNYTRGATKLYKGRLAGEAAENAHYLEHQGVALGVHSSASFLESLTGLDSSQCEHRLGASDAGRKGRVGVLLPDWSVTVGERDPARGENTYMLKHKDTEELARSRSSEPSCRPQVAQANGVLEDFGAE